MFVFVIQESVTTTARLAIGINADKSSNPPLASASSLAPNIGSPADFVLLYGTTSVRDAALAPAYDRITIKAGAVVARRWAGRWVASESESGSEW